MDPVTFWTLIYLKTGEILSCKLNINNRHFPQIQIQKARTHGERIARHNWLRDDLFNTAVAACLGPTREGRALLPGEGGKPADVFLPHWAQGKDAALDVREAPLRLASPLFGHCPNSNCPPPPRTQKGTLGHFFSGRFERLCQITVLRVYKCHKESWQALNPLLTKGNAQLNFNFHCISAPNHPGRGLDPPKIKQMPV